MASQIPTLPNGRPEPGQILLVIHDFTARSSDELSLSKGDRVKLVERDDDFGDGWYLGDHLTNGHRGLFPEVYTKPAPRGLPTARPSVPGPTSGASIPISQPPMIQPATKPVAVSNPVPDPSAFDSRKSVPAPELDRTQQVSRHVSASELHNNSTSTPPLITVKKIEDTSENSFLTGPTKTSPPKNPIIPPVAGMNSLDLASPVMNETLSVIQEHISDMSTPRHSIRDRHNPNDSGSEYSGHMDHRLSYINGEETDEEEENQLTEAEVSQWDPDQVAQYLISVGVEQRHCQVFRDQEITGDVLLGMDQQSVMIKEFELGPLGRRLKLWQRIKALQDEVKSATPAATRRTTQTYEGSEVSSADTSRSQSRSRSNTAANAGMSSVAERLGSHQITRYSQQPQAGRSNSMQAISPKTTYIPENMESMQERSVTMIMESPTRPAAGDKRRPSAASIRDLHHSRRFSSNDYGANLLASTLSGTGADSPTKGSEQSHKKAPSFDRNWTMGSQSPATPMRPLSSSGDKLLGSEEENGLQGVNITTPWEFDRGYFSGGDTDIRQRNVLRKRGTSGGSHVHSRNSSYTDEQRIRTGTTNARHSRFGSVDSIHDQHRSPASQKYYGMSTSRRRVPSGDVSRPPPPNKDAPSPTVTKLDLTSSFKGTDSPRSPDQVQSPPWVQGGNQVASPRGTIPLRAASDAVTGSEKARMFPPGTESPIKENSTKSPSRTGSTTSGGPSFELESPNTSKSPSTMTTPASKTSRKKSKKETSAYTRGLEKKTPQEQMIGADYSGWMKKKSTNLMTTWKPRLFVLKGRRLSYYYSENDTEEKGLIDISFHRVLPADNDRITGLHATLTGATTSPTSPSNSHTPTIASQQAAAEPISSLGQLQVDSMFIFKLVPPRAGLSRAVNFTKPTVHYFAVPNITLGRLWMAALMKATIDRDHEAPITTTYQQKTISLEKARRMRHRPPALMNLDEKVEDEAVKTPGPDLSGLNIRGIIFDQDPYEGDSGVSGVSKPESAAMVKNSSNSGYPGGLGNPVDNGKPPSYKEQPQTA